MLQPITKENFSVMLSRFTTSELETLVAKYPYTREAHVLLAKKYQLENNPAFDVQLQFAALYTQDRELLYALFNDKPAEQRAFIQTQSPIIEAEIPEAETPVIEPEKQIEQPLQQEEVIVEVSPVIVTEEIQEVAPPPVVTEEEMPQPEIATLPVALSPTKDKKQVEVTPSITTPPVARFHTFDEWLSNFAQSAPVKKTIELASVEEEAPSTPQSTEEQEQEELEKMILQNSVSADYLHNMVDEETRYARGLDKFIEDQVKKHRRVDYKKGGEQDDIPVDMITETMAGIYEKQKKYSKAIRAYELLSLKFPEKNDLFAARINYLKTII